MSKVITVMNMKGGVGKTTVAAHVAGFLAGQDIWEIDYTAKKVLAIDYDPQFNLSQAWIRAKTYFAAEENNKTILSVLIDNPEDLDPYKIVVPGNNIPPKVSDLVHRCFKSDTGHLDIIPSTLDLMYLALGQPNKSLKPIEERFQRFIGECKKEYDYIFIDCHPAGSLFTKTSLQNSTDVLIPVVPDKFSVRGIGLMMKFIRESKKASQSLRSHILFNRVPRTGVDPTERDIRRDRTFAPHCMDNTLKKYGVFGDPEGGKGFAWASKKPYRLQAFWNLESVVTELVERLEN